MMPVRIHAFLSSVALVFLAGCSNLDINEKAWARCSVYGTTAITITTMSMGGSMAAGAVLGGTNASMGCFLVYERDGFNTGVEDFAHIREEKARIKAEKKAAKLAEKSEKNLTPREKLELQAAKAAENAALPVVPALPVIGALPVFEDETAGETTSSVAMPVFDDADPALPVVDEPSQDVALASDVSKDQKLTFDGTIGSVDEPLRIYFDDTGLTVDGQGEKHLKQLASWLLENPDNEIEMIGHSDQAGTASYNLQLSLQRVEEVLSYLVEQGVDEFQVLMDYRGAEQPIAANDSEANRSLNRRVDIIWQ